jgi:lipoprotein-anchoring transpeptidase ErfK/SrfK
MPLTSLSRRDFLKLSTLSLGLLAFSPFPPRQQEQDNGAIGRVAVSQLDIRAEPNFESEIIGKRYRDQLIRIYKTITPESGPAYNPYWYRIWGGYVHSMRIQPVKVRFNLPLSQIREGGQLAEVTVPFTQSYAYNRWDGWYLEYRLYYETAHWIVGLDEGPDGKAWYRLKDELGGAEYMVPAPHLRPIPDEELAPLSIDISPEDKRIEVNIATQTLQAFEKGKIVYEARISSGIPSSRPTENNIPSATPKGNFRIYSKMPSKHMGDGNLMRGALDLEAYELVGVPWTMFFAEPLIGYALHGTYWHNNFGWPMSRGCVNMRNADAKWLFRWTTPVADPQEVEKTGYGTQVFIY